MGLALFVAVGQLNKLFGVEKPEGNTVQKLLGIIRELPEANWTAFAIGAASVAVLFGLPRVNPKLPAGLVVLFATILVSKWLDLAGTQGVEVVGTLPQGLPSLAFTAVPLETYLAMVLPAIGVFLVAYSESLGVAHEFADKHGYEVDADQELNAHAATNILSSLFGGMLGRRQHVRLARSRRAQGPRPRSRTSSRGWRPSSRCCSSHRCSPPCPRPCSAR